VVETALAKVLLKERIDRSRWVGALFVTAGVALLML
jgi:drug/metabolite transporter (DMT)-like permease